MISGVLKSVLFAALAILLSAGHSVCAGIVAETGPVAEPQHQVMVMAGHDSHAGDSGGHHEHMPAAPETAPCGPDRHDCQHCKTAQFFKAPVKADSSVSFAASPIEKAVSALVDAPNRHLITAKVNRSASLWRGPPGETPVSLKIRLLI